MFFDRLPEPQKVHGNAAADCLPLEFSDNDRGMVPAGFLGRMLGVAAHEGHRNIYHACVVIHSRAPKSGWKSTGTISLGVASAIFSRQSPTQGSIKEAAKSVGKSYRHVWAKIKETEQALGAALVRTQVGGNEVRRSELTELGCDLVRDFEALRGKVLRLLSAGVSSVSCDPP